MNDDEVRREFSRRFAIEKQVPGQPSTFPCRACGARPDLRTETTPQRRAEWYATHTCARAGSQGAERQSRE